MGGVPNRPSEVKDSVAPSEPNVRHKGPADSIGQSRLPLTFGLADVVATSSKEANSKEGDGHEEQSLVKNLALKVLKILLFSGI